MGGVWSGEISTFRHFFSNLTSETDSVGGGWNKSCIGIWVVFVENNFHGISNLLKSNIISWYQVCGQSNHLFLPFMMPIMFSFCWHCHTGCYLYTGQHYIQTSYKCSGPLMDLNRKDRKVEIPHYNAVWCKTTFNYNVINTKLKLHISEYVTKNWTLWAL